MPSGTTAHIQPELIREEPFAKGLHKAQEIVRLIPGKLAPFVAKGDLRTEFILSRTRRGVGAARPEEVPESLPILSVKQEKLRLKLTQEEAWHGVDNRKLLPAGTSQETIHNAATT